MYVNRGFIVGQFLWPADDFCPERPGTGFSATGLCLDETRRFRLNRRAPCWPLLALHRSQRSWRTYGDDPRIRLGYGFLIGIFIVIGAVESVGLLKDFADWLQATGLRSPAVYLLILTWMSVVLSAFIDNVPYTILMIPVCGNLAQSLGVSPWPFYFGMLVGTGIRGNITPVGATANVLACGMLEQRGYRIDLGRYMKISVPFSVAAVAVVHILLQLIWL